MKARGNFLIERKTVDGRLVKRHWLKNTITDAGIKQATDRLVRTAAPNWNSLTLALWGSDISTGSAIASAASTVSATHRWSIELGSSSTYSGIANLVVKNGTVTIAHAARSEGSLPSSKPANEIWTITWGLGLSGGFSSLTSEQQGVAENLFLDMITHRNIGSLSALAVFQRHGSTQVGDTLDPTSSTIERVATATEDSVSQVFAIPAPASATDYDVTTRNGVGGALLFNRSSVLNVSAAGTYKVKWSFS